MSAAKYKDQLKFRRKIITPIRAMLRPIMSQPEVGLALGISPQAVEQIEVKALYKVTTRMRELCREAM